MAIEILDFPIDRMVMFYSYVSLPEGNDEEFAMENEPQRKSGLVMINGNFLLWKMMDYPLVSSNMATAGKSPN